MARRARPTAPPPRQQPPQSIQRTSVRRGSRGLGRRKASVQAQKQFVTQLQSELAEAEQDLARKVGVCVVLVARPAAMGRAGFSLLTSRRDVSCVDPVAPQWEEPCTGHIHCVWCVGRPWERVPGRKAVVGEHGSARHECEPGAGAYLQVMLCICRQCLTLGQPLPSPLRTGQSNDPAGCRVRRARC